MPTTHAAQLVREVQPLDEGMIHGVTFDGARVWFARDDEIVAFDPATDRVVARHAVPGARAGTAFDGELLYQLAGDRIVVLRPDDGRVVRTLPAPGPRASNSGMAHGDGHLFVGQYRDGKIYKIDAQTGAIVETFASDRFVTGVSCVDGGLWHGAEAEGQPGELRRIGRGGAVEERVTLPGGHVAGVEATRDGGFWYGTDRGRLRLVRRAPTA